MREFEDTYLKSAEYFGKEMSPVLERFGGEIPAGGRVLDLGIGQGRNSLPLARRGHPVVGVDISETGLATTRARVAPEDLPVQLWRGSFLDYDPDGIRFEAVLAFGLMQVLSRRDGASLIHRLRTWTRPGGLVFLTAWHVDDPDYDLASKQWLRIGLHSFRKEDGGVRTFLGRGEILDLMAGWRILHHFEGTGPEHRHADGEPHHHGRVELVAARGR